MSLRILGLLALFVLTNIVGVPTGSWAQVIAVDIGPGICTLAGTSPLNFPNPYTCGNITITPKAGGLANVTAVDGGSDILQFLNARITATQPVANLHIVVTREFVPGPSTTVAPVFYRTSANGVFNTTNLGNVLTVKSTVTEMVTSTTQQMFLQQETDGQPNVPPNGNLVSLPTAGTFNTQWLTPPHLSGNRMLKVDFWFTLANQNNQIQLDSIVIQNRPNKFCGDENECEDQGPSEEGCPDVGGGKR